MPAFLPGSVKGANLAGGLAANGNSARKTWLSTNYSLVRLGYAFDQLKSMGVDTVSVWVGLDVLLDKTANWGTALWTPAYNSYIDNWEEFLTDVVQAKGMKVYVHLFAWEGGTDFDSTCLIPTIDGAYLMDATTNLGDLDATPTAGASYSATPNDWRIIQGGASRVTYQASSGQPSACASEYAVDASTGRVILRGPIISCTVDTRIRVNLDLKGGANTLYVNFHDSADALLRQDSITVAPTGDWATYSGLVTPYNQPTGTAKVSIGVNVPSGSTATVGGARVAYASVSALNENYLDAAENFVGRYDTGTAYGTGVAGWSVFKEPYDNVNKVVLHPFLKDCFDRIVALGNAQAVGICSTSGTAPVTTAANQGWYNDAGHFYCLHIYDSAGDLPDVSALDNPWVLGEFGAANSGGSPTPLYSAVTNRDALIVMGPAALARGAGWLGVWAWDDNTTIGSRTDTADYATYIFGDAGQWIENWLADHKPAGSHHRRAAKNCLP